MGAEVAAPANLADGWIVCKTAGAEDGPYEAIQAARVAHAAAVAKAATPVLGEVIDALHRQAAMLGVTVSDSALARIAADAIDNLEHDPFEATDYSDALRAAGKSPATTPTPLAPQARPSKPGTKPGSGQTMPTAGTPPAHPSGTRPVGNPAAGNTAQGRGTGIGKADPRQAMVDRNVTARAAELERQGVPAAEALVKAELGAAGLTTSDTVAKIQKIYQEDLGYDRGRAQVTAAKNVSDELLKRYRAERDGQVAKAGPDPAAAEIASEIRLGRVAKSMSQEDLADEVGVSVQTIRSWESGHLPDGLHATRVAGALDGGMAMAKRIAEAREGR